MRYLILVVLLSSCSASWHLKQAIRKGAKEQVVYRNMKILVPEFKVNIKPLLTYDSNGFKSVIGKYDSLLTLQSQMVSIDEKQALERKLNTLRKRLMQGFLKDSIYHYEPDSLFKMTIFVRGGKIDSIAVKRKSYYQEKEVPVAQSISAPFNWRPLIIVLGIIALILYLIRKR